MVTIHEIPFVRIVIPFIAGIALGDCCPEATSFITTGFIITLFLIVLINKSKAYYPLKRHSYFLIFVALFLAGALHIQSNNHLSKNQKIPIFQDFYFEGFASNVKSNEGRFNCQFSVIKYFDQDSTFHSSFKTQLFISDYEGEIKDGDKVLINTMLTPIKKNQNPNTFDYKKYLRHKGIRYQANIDGSKVLSHNKSNRWIDAPLLINENAQQIISKHITNKENAGIAIGMITGNKDDIPQELIDTYSRVGTMHLLAVSGLHVGIISGFLFWLCSFWVNPKKNIYAMVFIIAAIWAFVIFTGAKPSTSRAGLMFTMLYISQYDNKIYNTYNAISFSALILLLINPHALFDLGFQLSYLAIISIIFFYPRLNRILDTRNMNSLLAKGWELAVLSISANILILPLSVFYFNKLPLSFPVSNIFAVPLAGVIVVGGFGLIAIDLCLPFLTSKYAFIYDLFISFTNWILKCIEQIPYSIIDNIWLSHFHLILLYIILLLVMIMFVKNKIVYIKYQLAGVLIFLVFSSFNSFKTSNQTKFTVYDIYGKTAIDFKFGNVTYFYHEDTLSEKTIAFNISPNRHASKFKKLTTINSGTYKSKGLERNKSLIIFSNSMIFIPQSKAELENIPKEIDYLIVNHTYGLNEIVIGETTQVILINDKYLNKWKTNISEDRVHRISKLGPFIKIINDV